MWIALATPRLPNLSNTLDGLMHRYWWSYSGTCLRCWTSVSEARPIADSRSVSEGTRCGIVVIWSELMASCVDGCNDS